MRRELNPVPCWSLAIFAGDKSYLATHYCFDVEFSACKSMILPQSMSSLEQGVTCKSKKITQVVPCRPENYLLHLIPLGSLYLYWWVSIWSAKQCCTHNLQVLTPKFTSASLKRVCEFCMIFTIQRLCDWDISDPVGPTKLLTSRLNVLNQLWPWQVCPKGGTHRKHYCIKDVYKKSPYPTDSLLSTLRTSGSWTLPVCVEEPVERVYCKFFLPSFSRNQDKRRSMLQ